MEKHISASPKRTRRRRSGDEYGEFLGFVRDHFASTAGNGPLFTTDAAGLWQAFVDGLPANERQHHTCHACRSFVERYGGLVVIGEDGKATPVMWGNEAPLFYGPAFVAARRIVAKARVTGVFLSSDSTWGQPATGEWRHMAVTPPAPMLLKRSVIRTAGQAMAEKREEYGMLCRGLAEFSSDTVAQALGILEAEALYRNEKCVGPARWLNEIHGKRAGLRGSARDNVTWLAVAKAPPGYCHVRTTMIGTLLEDIAAGLDFAAIKRRFGDKMSPLQYQRPQSEPSAGNIAQAEKIVAALRSAGSLERRFARLDDIQAKIWTPAPPREASKPAGQVFAHLASGSGRRAPIEAHGAKMTWEKFSRTVLPEAERIEVLVPSSGSFIALVTAANVDAPPILQWDTEEHRNPVSWYVYPGGSAATRWGLHGGQWAGVAAVTPLPFMWRDSGKFAHHGAGVVLVIDGCRDMDPRGGSALFPELLKSEYHSIRKTIEAYSRSAKIAGQEHASACGIDLRRGNTWSCRVRVTADGGAKVVIYDLDRWD